MFMINLQGKEPLFEQIKKQILQFIRLGILKPDDKLPSIRQLAQDLGINPNTVAKAYQQLESEGVVYTLNKKGVFVSKQADVFDKTDFIKQLENLIRKSKAVGISKHEITEILEKVYEEDYYA